jgi:acyl-coenzyme A thioesterase PaaI-like protein
MEPNTHPLIDRALCGEPLSLALGEASVALTMTSNMVVDAHGLVHGGFVFGLADHAAMLAVNDPLVVLGSAQTRFLAPVAVGERVVAHAVRERTEGRKHTVSVSAVVGDREVFSGTFVAYVLDRHVMDR